VVSFARTVEPPEPLHSYNPFSPQKKATHFSLYNLGASEINPFVTPKKTSEQRIERTPSPLPSASSAFRRASQTPPPLGAAISRARKRLRGEPVSPSPVKGKKQRVDGNSINAFQPMESDGDDDTMDEAMEDRSFVEDSPVKKSTFRLLFEAQDMPDQSRRGQPSMRNARYAPTEDFETMDGSDSIVS
jgi:hypothetical protein